MIQFFSPDIQTSRRLSAEDSGHAVRVLRKQPGDLIEVVDGAGRRFSCQLLDTDPRGASVEILSVEEIPSYWTQQIILAVAPTKNIDRIEWLVEKAIESGGDRFVPLRCEHSERKVVKTDRLRKIAISAMKQSLKATLPQIDEMTPLKDFLTTLDEDIPNLFMGYCSREYPLVSLVDRYRPRLSSVILIGPEGDFSPAEVEMAVKAGFIPSTFSPARLRTETAALFALNTIHVIDQINNHYKNTPCADN